MSDWNMRQAGRRDDMSYGKKSLRLIAQPDGDIIVSIDDDGVPIRGGNSLDAPHATVEFCNPAGGGGKSPHTRLALLKLFEAMILDAKEEPSGIPQYPVNLAKQMLQEEK